MRTETEVYPQIVDEATRLSFNDWFDSYKVCDNEKFVRFFRRAMNLRYNQYVQKLRIEAGSEYLNSDPSKFDWAVANYAEFQQKNWNTEDKNNNKSGTINHAESLDYSDTHTEKTIVDDKARTRGGASVDDQSIKDKYDENTKGADYTEGRSGSLQRTSPMSQSYTSEQMNFNDNRRGYINKTADGYNAGEKLEPEGGWDTDDAEMHSVSLHRNFPELNITNPSAVSDAHTSGSDINMSDNHYTTDNVRKFDKSYNEVESEKTNKGETVDGGQKGTKDYNEVSGESEVSNKNGKAETRIISTGRNNKPIAELLQDAQTYIEQSNAFEWLINDYDIKSCFYMIWEV